MNIDNIQDYYFYDFVEDYLGESLKGSGRIVSLNRNQNEVVLRYKRFKLNSVLKCEFVFSNERCLLSKNYWNNEDITQEWENFISKQLENTY